MAAEQKKRPRFTEGKTSPSIQAMIFSPRAATAIVKVKQEQEPEDLMAEQVVTGLNAKKKWLHCAACPAPLKPPIFKCESGHVVCCTCGGGNNHCVACGCAGAATYTHLPHMDGLIGALELPCPYRKFGCGASIAYHALAEHKATCALAPCYCLQCTPPFEGAPASLVRHLTDEAGRHRWPAPEMIEYGTEHAFFLPASSSSGDHRRLLVAKEDGGVFLLAVGACRGAAGVRPFNVVCVRGKAGARPVYKGTVKVKGPPDEDGDALGFVVYGKIASCAAPGDVDMEQGRLHAHVNPAMLHGDSKDLHLAICI
ncbi:unnamed protein product [Alopecurus aequalis]